MSETGAQELLAGLERRFEREDFVVEILRARRGVPAPAGASSPPGSALLHADLEEDGVDLVKPSPTVPGGWKGRGGLTRQEAGEEGDRGAAEDRPGGEGAGAEASAPRPPPPAAHPPPPGGESVQRDWWEVGGDGRLRKLTEATGDYIVVDHEDAVDALASFVAAYLAAIPDTAGLDPDKLREALVKSVAELRRGRVRRALDWGSSAYRLAALSYGAFSAYTSPWIARAVLSALWAALRAISAGVAG